MVLKCQGVTVFLFDQRAGIDNTLDIGHPRVGAVRIKATQYEQYKRCERFTAEAWFISTLAYRNMV